MLTAELAFADSQLLVGERSALYRAPLYTITQQHIDQGFVRSPDMCNFSMTNSYGYAKISVYLENSDEFGSELFDWLIATTLMISSDCLLLMTTPDGEELEVPVEPGLYRITFGRRVVISSDCELEEEEQPIEAVSILLTRTTSVEPSQVLIAPKDAKLPEPLLEDS